MNSISDNTFQPSKFWPLAYHMCAYLVQIDVECDAQPSNDVNYFKMLYVVVIMLRRFLQAFLIKYNKNTMAEIDMCIYRVLHWKFLVQYHRQI